MAEVRVIAGLGEKRSNGGTQWFQQDRIYDPGGVAPALMRDKSDLLVMVKGMKINKVIQATDGFDQAGRVYGIDGISPTLGTGHAMSEVRVLVGVVNVDKEHDHKVRIRRLTPKECFRLQGFPDEYFERAASVNSDAQLYKQAGNAVTVNVIYEIAKRLTDD